MKKKKLLALLTAIAITAIAALPAGAQAPEPVYIYLEDGQVEIYSTEGQIQPRYTYVDTVTASLRESSGYATCTGTVEMQRSSYSFDWELVVEYSSDKKTWVLEEQWSGSDTGFAIIEQNCYLRPNYYHRLAVKVHVGAENITRYSGTVNY